MTHPSQLFLVIQPQQDIVFPHTNAPFRLINAIIAQYCFNIILILFLIVTIWFSLELFTSSEDIRDSLPFAMI
jgi:hypothetical protein